MGNEELQKLFNDLESNQSQKCEEAKKILVDLFNQTKEVWLVHGMMDYFLKTGSLRIIEVLVKVQSPHDTHIFDRLTEWLKSSSHRLQALMLFGFVVRKHPSWLYKIEKHKIIKDILKLLLTEKEIVLFMSALLGIVTLLPIIPMIVSAFLTDLFEVFGHVASWKSEKPNKLGEDKLAHLQIGLEMLFHRLYGMYPHAFLKYLIKFAKNEEKGAIFEHTIKPLLDKVRLHPMLVTPDKEMSLTRWKDMEAHDVVVECEKLSVVDQELYTEYVHSKDTPKSMLNQSPYNREPIAYSGVASPFQSLTDREQRSDFKKGEELWSPYMEITSSASTMPHTPTPSYGVPMSSGSSSGPLGAIMGVTGSSPPEAAVEATPETTPMKELTMRAPPSQHAVCAIFGASQPASPMRRDPSLHFTFPESPGPGSNQQGFTEHTTINKIPTKLYDQKMQHVLNDRHQLRQSASCAKTALSPLMHETYPLNASNNGTPSFDSQAISQEDEEVRDLTSSVALCVEVPEAETEDIVKRFMDCEEHELSPFSMSEVQGMSRSARTTIKKNRLGSYLVSDSSSNKVNSSDETNGRTGAYRKQSCTTKSRITQTTETWALSYENTLYNLSSEINLSRAKVRESECNFPKPQELLKQYVERAAKSKDSVCRMDQEHCQLLLLLLEYEKQRRETHAERNRRLMGRSRDICSLEREQERLKDNLKTYDEENRRLVYLIDSTTKLAHDNERRLVGELSSVKARYQEELERKKILLLNNETLQSRLNEEIQKRIELSVEVDSLRGQIFDMQNELHHAQIQAEQGQQCKHELVRLESEFFVMGEVQMKLRDRLAEVDNMRARDEEITHLQESYNVEIKDLRRALEEKTSQFETAKHKLGELQAQMVSNEKVVTDQKRLLKTVKDEYEEKFKALNKKYEVQKTVILNMEETLLNLYRNQAPVNTIPCSPDTDRMDMERNSPLSTSLASSESYPASLQSVTEIRNLQAFAEPANTATAASASSAATNIPLGNYHYSPHHQPTVVEASAVIRRDGSSESTATHTLDVPVPVANTAHYHHQQ